jgi:hypothetical protein
MAARHVVPDFGLPYASPDFDELGYHVVCSVCGAKCRPKSKRSEDDVTKGALAAYQEHFARRARVDAEGVASISTG